MVTYDMIISPKFWTNALLLLGGHVWSLAKIVFFFLLVRSVLYKLIDRVLVTVANRDSGESGTMTASRVRTLGSLIHSVIFYVLVFVSGVMILKEFDIDISPVLTAAGVVGLAVGFGAQKLVKDIISGFFIVLENQYSVGDYVTIGTVTGTVVDLEMRVTKLRDDIGRLIIVPNGDVPIVINHSRGPIQAMIEVSVAPESDLDNVRSVIDRGGEEICNSVDGVITPPKADGLVATDATKITLRVVCQVKAGRQADVQAALREKIRDCLIKAGIKLA